ncbi:hypothetical protein GCM10009839_26420 [Catenulispora yoronensis]|uniref:Glycosyltransferase RgtA/B/C/D-like domain-containing protein n=1 Tax=Catenulispora yoronensis TaxID=450799 RepID=A0ABP5FJC4_9ACTN
MDTLLRLGRRARGEVPPIAWLILLLVFVTEYWWWHSRVKLWDGDALYYVAAALKFAGHSTDEALRQTGVFFHQEDTVDRIRGTLTGVAGQPGAGAHNLEAPRFFYSFLAVPFIWVFGAKGIWIVSLLCALGFLYVAMRLLTRLFGVQLALALLLLYQIAYSFWFFQTGLYTESLAALLIVLILTRLPLGRTTTRNDLICIGVLLVVLAFTRQTVPVPAAAIVFAWLWTAIRTRTWGRANEWAAPALVAGGVGVAAVGLVSTLFPFNELRHYSEVNHLGNVAYVKAHLGQTLGKIPGLVVDMFAREFRGAFAGDHGLQVLWLLTAVAILWRLRGVYAAMVVGSALACAFLSILDATGRTSLRYFVPMYPMALLLIADFWQSRDWSLRTLPSRPGPGTAESEPPAPQPAARRTTAPTHPATEPSTP